MKHKKKCTIVFTDKSKEDFSMLPKDLIHDCLYQLEKLENDINLGKRLHNKNGKDLSSCRKIYFANATYRIVYREIEDLCTILEIEEVPTPIAEVVAIGKREGQEVYEIAADRLAEDDTQKKNWLSR